MFCREAVRDIAACRTAITRDGTAIVFVHMATEEQAAAFFAGYRVDDLPRVSDPERRLYRAFGLEQGAASQLLGPKTLLRAVGAFARVGMGIGKPMGDASQMPGVFMVHHGKALSAYVHSHAGSRPDYAAIARA